MFYITDISDGYIFHNKGKMILFDTMEEAAAFLQSFISFALGMYVQEFKEPPLAVLSKQQTLKILPWRFEEEYSTINFREIEK